MGVWGVLVVVFWAFWDDTCVLDFATDFFLALVLRDVFFVIFAQISFIAAYIPLSFPLSLSLLI